MTEAEGTGETTGAGVCEAVGRARPLVPPSSVEVAASSSAFPVAAGLADVDGVGGFWPSVIDSVGVVSGTEVSGELGVGVPVSVLDGEVGVGVPVDEMLGEPLGVGLPLGEPLADGEQLGVAPPPGPPP